MNSTLILIIFIITYIGIIFTRLPRVNIDRPSAAFFGAVAMIVFGATSFGDAVAMIDYNTIGLLLGMMIIISSLQQDGFFSLIAVKTLSISKNQRILLNVVVFVTGIASAFLVNDAVVLLFTPIIITICRKSGLNPIPYLIAEILASNVGSTMTITGNPQNMLIGIASQIDYTRFLLLLLPISLIGLWLITWFVKKMYKTEFLKAEPVRFNPDDYPFRYSTMLRSGSVFILVTLAFFAGKIIGISISLIALAGASLILLVGKVRPSEVIRKVDWVLLLFFSSLFIVVGVVEKAGIFDPLLQREILKPNINGLIGIHTISFILSQIISNVPLTIVMIPFLSLHQSEILWLSLASATTLAGNATIIGAMANLIVIETAEKDGVKIRFWEFLKTGLPLTIITLIFSFFYFYLLILIGLK